MINLWTVDQPIVIGNNKLTEMWDQFLSFTIVGEYLPARSNSKKVTLTLKFLRQ
jgi:hypothetical protein